MSVGLKVRSQMLLLSGISLTLFAIALLAILFALQASQARFSNYIEHDAKRPGSAQHHARSGQPPGL